MASSRQYDVVLWWDTLAGQELARRLMQQGIGSNEARDLVQRRDSDVLARATITEALEQ